MSGLHAICATQKSGGAGSVKNKKEQNEKRFSTLLQFGWLANHDSPSE